MKKHETNETIFTIQIYNEIDGSITISLDQIDLVENADTLENAKFKLAEAILEYSQDYKKEFSYWSTAPNRVQHIPYVQRALDLNDAERIKKLISD